MTLATVLLVALLLVVAIAVTAFVVSRFAVAQARETEKLKYEFITVAAHKLRTPLTRIRWTIPALLAKAGDDAELREGIRRVDDATNRLIELTNMLMEAAQPGGTYDYQQIAVDLRYLAWETIKHFSTQISEKKLIVAVHAADPPKALGDARRVALVIEALIENAVMYTPPGGSITLEITREGRHVRCAVTDTGIGVDPADQVNIFSSFFRTGAARAVDTEGVGLGLSLAKNIVERQGGRIGIASKGSGQGSTFWFTLPIANE